MYIDGLMAARQPKALSDQIRAAIRASAHSRYAIWKATGIDQGALSHFMAGHRGLSLASLDELCEFLELELRPVRRSPKGR